MKIIFTGGGTAGHIFPIISVVRELKKHFANSGFEYYYVGPKNKFFNDLLSKEGIKVKTVLSGKLRRYFSLMNIIDIVFKLPLGILQAFYQVFVISPDLIFCKGGYGSIPVIVSAWILRSPVFLHESDVVPGFANKIAGKNALEIFTSFPVEKTEVFPPEKMIFTGNPVRENLALYQVSVNEAMRILGLTGEKPVLFFIGGSQGAQLINDVLLEALPDFLSNFEIIHQTGKKNLEQVKKEAGIMVGKNEIKYYHPIAFLEETELSSALAVSDLVISRAGAGIIFELAYLGKPSILIPLANSAQGHQLKNAYAYSQSGAAIVMEEANLKAHFLLEKIKTLFSREEKLKEMSEKAKNFSKPDAAFLIANYIAAYLS